MAKTSRQSFQQMLRLTEDLRDQLRAAAGASGRSMNAEIVSRLEESFAVAKSLEEAPERLSELGGTDRAALITRILDQNRQLLAILEFSELSVEARTQED